VALTSCAGPPPGEASPAATGDTTNLAPEEWSGTTRAVPGEFPTIQAAVDAAEPGDLVLVDRGTYRESVAVTTPGLTIRGVDRNEVSGSLEVTLSPRSPDFHCRSPHHATVLPLAPRMVPAPDEGLRRRRESCVVASTSTGRAEGEERCSEGPSMAVALAGGLVRGVGFGWWGRPALGFGVARGGGLLLDGLFESVGRVLLVGEGVVVAAA
jgi:hypothetical protein